MRALLQPLAVIAAATVTDWAVSSGWHAVTWGLGALFGLFLGLSVQQKRRTR
jgi:hypothetical protein